jgi:hypothetical protein
MIAKSGQRFIVGFGKRRDSGWLRSMHGEGGGEVKGER